MDDVGDRLSVDKLKTLSTQRLLTILKQARKNMARSGWQVGIEGDDEYQESYEFFDKYCNDIKAILKDRPHFERKPRKSRGCPQEKQKKRKEKVRLTPYERLM